MLGLATARALARAGRDVAVCEQFTLGHDRGSSHGRSRIFRLSYPDAGWVRLAQESLPLWRELETESGRTLLDLRGSLDVGEWQANRDALSSCGAPFEVLDATEIERRFPLRAEPDSHGLFQPDGGIVFADVALAVLAAAAVEAGARLLEEHRVEAVEETRDGVEAGGIRARAAVVTAGAWGIGLSGIDAAATCETVSYFAFEEPLPSLIDTAAGPQPGYALMAPVGLLKAGFHKSGPPVDPDEPGGPDTGVAERTAAWVERRFRGAGAPAHLETCLYTLRERDEFLLEQRGRLVVGSACSGHGFKFAPLVGRRLAALALEAL